MGQVLYGDPMLRKKLHGDPVLRQRVGWELQLPAWDEFLSGRILHHAAAGRIKSRAVDSYGTCDVPVNGTQSWKAE
jgi:hypothetical protein